jgi:hypothetical protein
VRVAAEQLEKSAWLSEYFKAVQGKKPSHRFLLQLAAHEAPVAMVFSWKALVSSSLPEELDFLFRLMSNLKIFVTLEGSESDQKEQMDIYDPKGILQDYREYGRSKQFIVLKDRSLQEAHKTACDFVGKGAEQESLVGLFVSEGEEDNIRFVGGKNLNRFVALTKTRDDQKGILLALPSLGLKTMLGEKELPENVQKDPSGFYRVFAFSLGEISEKIKQEFLTRIRLSQAA